MVKEEQKKSGGNRRSYKPQGKPPQMKNKFKSDVSGLENFVFEYGLAKHAAQYIETEKAIANYVQKEYTKGGPEIAEAIRSGKLPTIQSHQNPSVEMNSISEFGFTATRGRPHTAWQHRV